MSRVGFWLAVVSFCVLSWGSQAQELPPLFAAIQRGDLDGVKGLLDGGVSANLTVQDTSALMFAAASGVQDVALLLLERGADAKEVGPQQFTPLHLAMQRCSYRLLDKLVELGADVNAVTTQSATPLHLAAEAGCLKAVAPLVKAGATIDARAVGGFQPVHLAARTWNSTMLEQLLDNGADANARTDEGITPLMMAVDGKKKDIIRLLLQKGADPNVTTSAGVAPLHVACEQNEKEIATILLDSKADIDIATKDGLTPLMFACNKSWADSLVTLLLDRGANVKAVAANGTTPLHYAVQRGWTDIVKRMLAEGADPSAKAEGDVTPLSVAREGGRSSIVKLLEAAGGAEGDPFLLLMSAAAAGSATRLKEALAIEGALAKINGKDTGGRSPLHAAAADGNAECINLLLDQGAAIDAVDNEGNTPLHYAADRREWNAARILLRRGADRTIKNKIGKDAPAIAAMHSYPDILTKKSLTRELSEAAKQGEQKPIEDFLANGGDINAVDDAGSLLHYAVANWRMPLANWLLDKGASLETVPGSGEPIIFYAVRKKDMRMLEFLLSKGASLKAEGSLQATPFMVALAVPWVEGARKLLDKGASLNVDAALFHYGPLHYAVLGGNMELVRLLLDKGVPINVNATYKGTPLHLAAEEGKLDIVKLLVERGADVNATDPEYGEIPLHKAASQFCSITGRFEPTHPLMPDPCPQKVDVARYLLSKGATVNATSKHDWTPMDYAKTPEMKKLLEKHGGKRVKTKDK